MKSAPLHVNIVSMRDVRRQRDWQNADIKRKRLAWLALNGPCQKCGSSDNLEVDHIDPAQKVDHKVWTWKRVRRDVELAKCQALCRDCHKKKSAEYSRRPLSHGSAGYGRGCRCEVCRKYQTDRMAKYHQDNPRRQILPG